MKFFPCSYALLLRLISSFPFLPFPFLSEKPAMLSENLGKFFQKKTIDKLA